MRQIEKTVFICYRRADLPWALAIYQDLTSHGYDVFFDFMSLNSGDFEDLIIGNIKARAHFLIVLTPTSLQKCINPQDWVRREIESAMQTKRNIVPLMIEGFDFNDSSTVKLLTGSLTKLNLYNGLQIPSQYFSEAMERLRNRFLNIPIKTVLHPLSSVVKSATQEQKNTTDNAIDKFISSPLIRDDSNIELSNYVKTLINKVEEQSTKIKSEKGQEPSVSSVRDAYLHFIYNISHEVVNPVQSIQINLELMVNCSPEETDRSHQYLITIKQEMKRIFVLIDNLRILSHIESIVEPIKHEPVNLTKVIEDVFMAQAERAENRNIALRLEVPNKSPAKVLGDREYLYQLFLNLVDNSIKYSKDSGGKIDIKLAEESNWMHISVSDDGIGIPKEDLPFAFDTSYRSPNKGSIYRTGSGLGLSIVKRIVDQLEGKVRIDSIIGVGTTVTISFLVYKPADQ